MKHIVIADDSSTARMFIKRCLEIVGCRDAEFQEAENGLEVIDLLKENRADLVVTDLNMPEMNGLDLLKRMKASPRMNDIPVLVITSVANPEREKELLSLGALAVLGKPVSPAGMAPVIKGLLGDEEAM